MVPSASAAVLDLEITGRLTALAVPSGQSALVLFRLHGRPLGWGNSRVTDGRLDGHALIRQFLQLHTWSCALPLAERAVCSGGPPRSFDVNSLLHSPPQKLSPGLLVTVAIRSRTPAGQLQPCLDSVLRLDYPSLDVVLVDASEDRRQVERMVRDLYPRIRYISAPGPGVATRRAVEACQGDILALTDGDSLVDPGWVSSLVQVFLADPEVMTVSGLVLPRRLRRPFRPALPAGSPFARRWWRTRGGWESIEEATDRALERASPNIAYWRPGSSRPTRATRVWEPAAIVRTLVAPPIPGPWPGREPARELDRPVDLAMPLTSLDDASSYEGVRLHVTWAGSPLGLVRIHHQGAVVSPMWASDAIAQQLTSAVLDAGLGLGPDVSRALLTADLARYILPRWRDNQRESPATAAASTAAA